MARESFFCFSMVCPAGIEPAAYSLGGCRSIRLSYGHMGWFAVRFCLIRARGRVKSILVQGLFKGQNPSGVGQAGLSKHSRRQKAGQAQNHSREIKKSHPLEQGEFTRGQARIDDNLGHNAAIQGRNFLFVGQIAFT